MTISKKALADFLDRKLDDWSFLKQWTRQELLAELRTLEVRPRITSPYKHWHHQLVGLLLFCLFDGFLLFLDMGSGKTRIMLEAFAYRRRAGEASRALILALNDVNVFAIEDDASIHTPQFRCQPLVGSSEERWYDLENSDAHVFIMSYAGLRAMCTKKVKRKGRNVLVADERKIKRLCKVIDWAAYDEIHKCKNHRTATFMLCKYLSKHSRFHYGSTGTGFGRNPEDLWAEFLLADKGESLGTTLGLFREAFFIEKDNYWGGKEYTFDRRQKAEFKAAIRNRSIYYRDSEIGDMPRRRPQKILLRPEKELALHYNEALESLQTAARNNEIENNWIRLRMICSGFISYKGEDSERIQIELPNNPKIAALESFIEQVPIDVKGIIVHEFVYSGLIIERVLKELGQAYLTLNGKQKDKRGAYNKFRKDTKHRFLVMNWRSGGTGGNYQVAPYMHFYETPVSPIERKQTEARIRRRNNKYRRVYYRDPVIKGSVEEDILAYLKEGRNLYKELMDGSKCKKGFRRLRD